MNCPSCGYDQVPQRARFCPMCRAALPAALPTRRTPQSLMLEKIIPYQELIDRSTTGFVGRQWVRDAVDEFLRAFAPRHFLLLGEPGCGKTAFMAQLVKERHYPHHFIGQGAQTGPAAALDWRDPVRFAESIGYQLVREYGSWIMDWERWGIPVSQKVRDLEGLLVGAALGTYKATPGRTALTVKQEVEQFGPAAGIIGVYVDTWKVDVERVVGQLVIDPLRAIADRWPGRQVVVVVDGLDEAASYSSAERNILRLLPLGGLPSNVRLLLSSRYGRHLTHDLLAQVHPVWLSEDPDGRLHPGALVDAEEHLRRLAQDRTVSRMLERRDVDPEAFVDQVAKASAGNFLYLYHYAAGLRAGVASLLDLEALPSGLYGIYADLLSSMAERAGVSWNDAYKPVLATLAVARAPLDREQIATFSEVDRQTVGTVLTEASQFLPPIGAGRHARYALYHDSFGEYLVSPDNEDTIDGPAAHGRIAHYYLSRYADDWSRVPPDDEYGLEALVHHLLHAALPPEERRTRLEQVLDVPFMRVRGDRSGWHMPFVRDLKQVADRFPDQVVRPCVNVLRGHHRNSLANQTALRLLVQVRPELLQQDRWPAFDRPNDQAILDAVALLDGPPGEAIGKLHERLAYTFVPQENHPPQKRKSRRPKKRFVSPDPQVRGALALLLGETRNAEALDPLRRTLANDERHPSWCAADGLIALNTPVIHPGMLAALLNDLDHQDHGVRQRLLYVLGRLRLKPPFPQMVEVTERGLQLRANHKGRAVDLIWLWLPEGEGERREWVERFERFLWHTLGLDREAEEYLKPRWKDEWLQKRLVTALGRMGSAEAVPHLQRLLEAVRRRPRRRADNPQRQALLDQQRAELLKSINRAIDDLERRHL